MKREGRKIKGRCIIIGEKKKKKKKRSSRRTMEERPRIVAAPNL